MNEENQPLSSENSRPSPEALFSEAQIFITQGNLPMAVAKILDASDLEHPEATLIAAAMYFAGVGISRNQDEATKYAQKYIALSGESTSPKTKDAHAIIDGSIGTINARRLIFGDQKTALSTSNTPHSGGYTTLEEELAQIKKKNIMKMGIIAATLLIVATGAYRYLSTKSAQEEQTLTAMSADYNPQDTSALQPLDSFGYYEKLKFEEFEEKVLKLKTFTEPVDVADTEYIPSYTSSRKKDWKEDFKRAYRMGASTKAYALFEQLALDSTSQGYEESDISNWRDRAFFNMGVILQKGYGGNKPDSKLAFDAYNNALNANSKNFRAAYNLARMYEKGEGVSRNPSAARDLYERAAASNDEWAAYNLGNLAFSEGDYDKAIEMYEKLYSVDNFTGAYNLSLAIMRKSESNTSDEKHIYEVLLKAKDALRDNKEVLFMLGNLEYLGIGVPKNIEGAIARYSESGSKGFSLAYFALGKTYVDIKDDHDNAFKYYEKAANLNFPPAMFKLATYYYQGPALEGTPIKAKDLVSAYQWALLAKGGDFAPAVSLLQSLEKEMDAETINLAKKNAARWIPSK